jgi:hypothetical protein
MRLVGGRHKQPHKHCCSLCSGRCPQETAQKSALSLADAPEPRSPLAQNDFCLAPGQWHANRKGDAVEWSGDVREHRVILEALTAANFSERTGPLAIRYHRDALFRARALRLFCERSRIELARQRRNKGTLRFPCHGARTSTLSSRCSIFATSQAREICS